MLRFRQLLNIVLFDLEYRTIRFGISFYTILNIVLYDLGYRSIRFGISFYTIWDSVLYDSEYRSIRFGISFYTIRNIVLYDLEYRSVRFRETLSGVAKTRVMGWGEASCNLQPTPHVALGHADGCLWRQQVSHLPMGFQVGRDVAFDYS